jgi:hypothetical protein
MSSNKGYARDLRTKYLSSQMTDYPVQQTKNLDMKQRYDVNLNRRPPTRWLNLDLQCQKPAYSLIFSFHYILLLFFPPFFCFSSFLHYFICRFSFSFFICMFSFQSIILSIIHQFIHKVFTLFFFPCLYIFFFVLSFRFLPILTSASVDH